MVSNSSLIFAKAPTEFPQPGQHLKKETKEFDLDQSLPEGSVLAKTVVLSLDPYLRGRMRDGGESYVPAFDKGKPIQNFGVSKIVKSANSAFKEGAHIYGTQDFSEYIVLSGDQLKGYKVLENKENLPWSYYVGVAGMPGQTAVYGLKQIAKLKKGETIFVSGASGAVGQLVIALAHSVGAKVIASAGSEDKVDYLKNELKVEVAFNYKTESTEKVLKANPFNAYWDNVGGETLETVLNTISEYGRIVACGAIADYNTPNPYGIKNSFQVVAKSLLMQGFIVLKTDIGDFYDVIPPKIASGEINPPKEHIVKGIDQGEAFLDLLKGANFGKAVVSLE
ncbi:NAD-P-binding protein [Leucosporidium creatinivorum]|uniref:NAD-P-binding protein n=1 Tax=Leucosporidium creatinivorum TaxID=106004 RepID=A0A1Y2G0X1_9BASI|nr:NAD-P-binding protein [Leucosporidium creatinivorum]